MKYFRLSHFSIQINLNPIMKRKYFFLTLLFVILIINGCGKIPDGVVDNHFANYKVNMINTPANFTYSSTDSLLTISIQLSNYSSVNKVWASIKSENGASLITSNLELLDDGIKIHGDATAGDGIYSMTYPMSKKYSNGKYIVEFFVEDNLGLGAQSIAKVGEQAMNYDNKQVNYSPVISNLLIPASVTRGVKFQFSIFVADQNSLGDISSVYYSLFKPDGTLMVNSQGLSQFPMFDDGNTTNDGDAAANDGIYTVILTFPETQPAGNWKFELQAKDKSGAVSNVISKTIEVK